MEEVWKDIVGFEGLYQFSNLYRVKSTPRTGTRGGILKICVDALGYPRVVLHKNCKPSVRKIHRLVLEYSVGPCPFGMECRHLNDIKTDYRIENLKWGTSSENQQDSIRNGTQYTGNHQGILTHNAKLVDENIPEIRKLIKQKISAKTIGQKFGVSRQCINDIKFDKTWQHIK